MEVWSTRERFLSLGAGCCWVVSSSSSSLALDSWHHQSGPFFPSDHLIQDVKPLKMTQRSVIVKWSSHSSEVTKMPVPRDQCQGRRDYSSPSVVACRKLPMFWFVHLLLFWRNKWCIALWFSISLFCDTKWRITMIFQRIEWLAWRKPFFVGLTEWLIKVLKRKKEYRIHSVWKLQKIYIHILHIKKCFHIPNPISTLT